MQGAEERVERRFAGCQCDVKCMPQSSSSSLALLLCSAFAVTVNQHLVPLLSDNEVGFL